MKETFVKPAKGSNGKTLTVLDDLGKPIPEKGSKIMLTTLISRLIKAGDLEVVTQVKKKGDK